MLYEHQIAGIDFLKNGGGCLFWEVGTGKTLTVIETFKRYRENHPYVKLLVICPISLIENAWATDIKKFSSFSYCNMRKAITFADIYIVNYEVAITKTRWENLRRLLNLGEFICCLDESSRIKSYNATTTKKLLLIRGMFKKRIVMSGTPCPNNELELWSQICFTSPGLLPENFFQFRNQYFELQRGKQRLPARTLDKNTMSKLFGQGWSWGIDPAKKKDLMDKIAPKCMWVLKKDCLDLPEEIDEVRTIELPDDMWKTYSQMREDCITEISGEHIVAQIALTKLMKLRQIGSGFSITPDGTIVKFPHNPKLTELLAALNEIGNNQVIIWTNFRQESRDIKEVLDSTRLDGETVDRDQVIQDFISGKIKYLIADKRSVAHGLTFTNCAYQIFYSLDYSAELYQQARGRTHRAGQTRACVYIHLIVKDTIDELIMQVLEKKIDSQDIIRKMME